MVSSGSCCPPRDQLWEAHAATAHKKNVGCCCLDLYGTVEKRIALNLWIVSDCVHTDRPPPRTPTLAAPCSPKWGNKAHVSHHSAVAAHLSSQCGSRRRVARGDEAAAAAAQQSSLPRKIHTAR